MQKEPGISAVMQVLLHETALSKKVEVVIERTLYADIIIRNTAWDGHMSLSQALKF